VDSAAAIQNILLAAWESGVGSCWIQSVDRKKVKKLFRIPHHVKLDSVVALGYPNEQPQAEDMMHSFRYYKDGKGTLHVPKRRLDTICFINEYVFSQKG
jgi:nitroreductase